MNKPILENTPVVNGYLSTEIQTAQVIEINNYTEDIFRKKFVSKVYSTLWIQLLFTSVYIGLCNQIPQLQKFLLSPIGINLMYVSIFSILLSSCCLFGYYEKLKITPYNYLYVFFFTIMMSYSLGLVGLMYNPQVLLLSGLSTTGIFSGLTIYAIQTKIDYTIYGNIGIIMLFGLLFFGLMISFLQIQMLQIVYSVGGASLFSFYIVYDTQLITGGSERKITYTIDDWAIASVNLYLDVVNLFLFLLDIMGGRN